ncbi:glycosyltransferase family 2 protein [Rhizobium tumorigenes]|uniref:Glycosyltransferase family 2 protein n=1 Tax=Rhizobium tumorigenes TaxID=2041385 RepID=A0AAF1K9W7_9HYPH|nr:glycosyltransferase family 2 protein [Rhizobium tumorigenes]WFR97159.1 glycosyltransferase family 2 protein [Rhizobium tumorigenes]WFS02719.1 glycosyltransferase family 2 protein [Rhizobium tumorigenes]
MSINEPLVLSICVPTYNRQFLLERNVTFHLDAFRRIGIPFEIVLVDDCSTDDTAAYIASLADQPEISAFRRATNSGFLSNYAFAMQRARGRYAVFLGDDDLLIPEKVIEYLRLMEADSEIGVVQAPWLLVDARPGGGDMSPFYHVASPTRHRKGDFRALLDFIIDGHIFPEFMIIRREVLLRSISSPTPFIFWAFLYTTRALDKADILFMPEPFARVTAVSDDPRLQQGNKECMFQWDSYRGGLEYLASQALRTPDLPQDYRASLMARITGFMLQRQAVALRLHVSAKNWVEAYIMYHRMAVYQPQPLTADAYGQICKLAAIVTAATEAVAFNGEPAILDPVINDTTLSLLPESIQQKLTRDQPTAMDGDRPRAYLRFTPEFPERHGAKDGVFDIMKYMAQFV